MKEKKKHKLLVISPAGEEYQIGFLSPCRDGFILGTSQIEKGEGSHLTILSKKGTISAHITPQKPSKERQYFLPLSVKEFAARFRSLLDNKMVFQLSQEQLSEDVMYVTIKFGDWLNALVKALFQKKTTKNEIVHILNFKNLYDQLPKLVDEFRTAPQSFFGLCKAKDMLKNNSIIAGVSDSKILIIPIEKELIGIDFRVFTNFDFIPSMDRSQLSNPLTEFYQSLGINQYIQQEVMAKKFLENLLSKEAREFKLVD
ncbi:hypothetical protein MUP77_12975 [Candidatus Bathyarchaeota archaeon]|nr:hypothetical protein [Candidatus Bathyarchaeota archaeon]